MSPGKMLVYLVTVKFIFALTDTGMLMLLNIKQLKLEK